MFGEWLIPHKVKYPENAYKKWYLFDICEINGDLELNRYLGFDTLKIRYKNFFSNMDYHFKENSRILLVPEYKIDSSEINSLADFDTLRANLSTKSLLGAKDGKSEGIIVSDLLKLVQVGEDTLGPLRVKCVNEAFKEIRNQKNPLDENEQNALAWANKYITEPRIQKQIFSLQEDGLLEGELVFDWLKNGNAKLIAEETLNDAIVESEEMPESLRVSSSSFEKNMKLVGKFTNKLVNKVIALMVKGIL